MLTFKKRGYTGDDMVALYRALTAARDSFHCSQNGCDQCKNRKPCADISRCREYICKVYD